MLLEQVRRELTKDLEKAEIKVSVHLQHLVEQIVVWQLLEVAEVYCHNHGMLEVLSNLSSSGLD